MPDVETAGETLVLVDRARVYRALACCFADPSPERVARLRSVETPELRESVERLDPGLTAVARDLARLLDEADAESLHEAYEQTFEPSGGLRCAPTEASHTVTTPQEGLTRTYELADVSGFYRAFGVELTAATERPDHITAELEFMHLLAVKELVARQADDGDHAAVCRHASEAFLRDHLGRWTSAFSERLDQVAADPLYAAAGRLLDGFVAGDAQRLESA